MAAQNMKKVNFTSLNPNSGAVYHEKITLTEADITEYIFPLKRIYSISADITGDGKIEFTIDSLANIEDGNAEYEEWDEVSDINLAVTGFKITWTSGTVVVKVTVKTDK